MTRASHCLLTCLHSSKEIHSSLALTDEQFWGSDLITKCHFFGRSSILSRSTLPSKWLPLCQWDKALEEVRRHVPKGQAHLHRMSVWALHQHKAHITEATLVPCNACSSSEKCFHNSPGTQIPMKQPKDQASGSVPECTGGSGVGRTAQSPGKRLFCASRSSALQPGRHREAVQLDQARGKVYETVTTRFVQTRMTLVCKVKPEL